MEKYPGVTDVEKHSSARVLAMAACHKSQLFSNVVQTLMNNWTALQIAVQNQLGGSRSKEIAAWMVEVVDNFFYENEDLDGDEVADYIGEIMNNEFNTLCEDGSLEEIGEQLCKFFRCIRAGRDQEVLQELEKIKPSSGASHSKTIDVSVEESAEMDVVEPMNNLSVHTNHKPNNEPDEDGWITVGRNKK